MLLRRTLSSKASYGTRAVQSHRRSYAHSSEHLMHLEHERVAHTYHPVPVVFEKAQGVHVWDPEGRKYYDFLSAYSAVNQGHCHPKIIKALTDQASKLTLSSRAFFNSVLPLFAEQITVMFGYDKMLPMNSGAEAVESAIKTARRWGYMRKGIPTDKGIIISLSENFHGRTVAIISASTDPGTKESFGPFVPGWVTIPFNDLGALEKVLNEMGKHVCGFLLEPIQGEAGVKVPDEGYLTKAYQLCKKHNVLFIDDEIQTGLARTGKMLAVDWEPEVKPDIVILGKALSGGVLPVSCILANNEVMDVFSPGTHGSTFGGNPLASAVAMAALNVLKDEKLADNAQRMGEKVRSTLSSYRKEFPFVTAVRGKGLLNAIDIDPKHPKSAWEICLSLKDRGLLAKPTHDHTIRLAPPLVINEEQVTECLAIIKDSLHANRE